MRGFELTINGEKIEGAIGEGITSIVLSCKDNQYNINFGSMDNTGMLTYTWFSSDLKQGSKLKIVSKEVSVTLNPIDIRDYNNKEQMDKLELESYFKLRDELIKEGLIDGQDK
jgi:hypothetical protein